MLHEGQKLGVNLKGTGHIKMYIYSSFTDPRAIEDDFFLQ